MKYDYYDSFIPLEKNKINSPSEAAFFFSKAYKDDEKIVYLEGYAISKNGYKLISVVYNLDVDSLDTKEHLIAEHLNKKSNVTFVIAHHSFIDEKFKLKEYYYDSNGKLMYIRIFSGKQAWNWEEEERLDKNGETTEFIEYILDDNFNLLKEISYTKKGGDIINEESYED